MFSFLTVASYSQNKEYDDLYYTHSAIRDSVKSDIQNIKYCLGRYSEQRTTGLSLFVIGSAISALSLQALDNSSEVQKVITIGGGILSLVGIGITIDAEKWTHRASISVSPGGVKINF